MSGVIASPDAVSSEWLTKVLRQDGCLVQGKVVSIRISSEPSYTSTIARLNVTYSNDATLSAPPQLFLKLSRLDSKQSVVGSEQRRSEVEFHNKITTFMISPPVVRCYNAVYCEETGRSHLLFKDLSESHYATSLSKPPPLHQSENAIDAFAEFHAFWWDHPALGDIDKLPSQESVDQHIANIREHFPQFAEFLGDRLSHPQRQIYEKALFALSRLWQRVSAGTNLTLIHGDANFSNVLLPRDPNRERALIIDWQLWGSSFAAEDLVHMIALFWNKEYRLNMEKSLLQHYHRRLVHHGVKNYTWNDCWYDYRLAIILRVLFMPMWFWSSGVPESSWQRSLTQAVQAFEDLGCQELLELP